MRNALGVLMGALCACAGLILLARAAGPFDRFYGSVFLLFGVVTFVSVLRRLR